MYIDFKSLLLEPSGQVGRTQFWVGVGILALASFLVGLLPVVGPWLALALIWPWYCLLGKRLRDMGRSPALAVAAVAPMLVTAVVSAIVSTTFATPAMTLLLLPIVGLLTTLILLASIAVAAVVIWLGVSPGRA
jgi:uncharacterized membrane protein YhaH (DUF805 family)